MDIIVDWNFTSEEFPSGDPYGESETPKIVNVPDYVVEETELPYTDDYVADWLSDEYGWCVMDWKVADN